MRLTVVDWGNIQNECFTDEEHSETFRDDAHCFLFHTIETRTWGKQWSKPVMIGLKNTLHGDLEPIAKAALQRAKERDDAKKSFS